ncbi:MAG: GMC family oxidoreductase [Vicinamibacterales bacterium]
MPPPLSRRAFLAGAAALLPAARVGAQTQDVPAAVDVVVVGGDPAALAATYRLAQADGVRVALVEDTPPWAPPAPAFPDAIADLPPFVRGHAAGFDRWRDAGNPGWGYADVVPSFMRLERYEAGASAHRGGDGPVPVAHCWDPHPGHRTFLLACNSGGFAQDSRHDFNGPRSQSVGGYYQKVIADDRPVRLEAALVDPVRKRPGVAVIAGAAVTRLVVDGRRVVGVELTREGQRLVVRAGRAVILAAGPARAAQLLLVSGIGPAEHLRQVGIGVVADRPGVGTTLHDQVRVALRWQALPPAEAWPASTVTAGFFTVSLVASPPDLQMDFVDPRRAGAARLGLDITNVQPTSRGTVRLTSADPARGPAIDARTLTTDGDVTALVQGIRLARLVGTSPQLDRFRTGEIADSAGAVSTPDLQAYVRGAAVPCGHLAGACAMGPAGDAAAVVGATLAVHGLEGLRVAGTAVMPMVVNAPPDAAALMIGDRCAQFVLDGPA